MFKMNSWTRIDVSSFNELHCDSMSNSINALVPTDMSEGRSDSSEMERVAPDCRNSFSLNSCSDVSKTNRSRNSVENIINSGDECLEDDEFRAATHPKVTEKDVSIKKLSSHLSITGVHFDNLNTKLKESEKQLNESKSHHHHEAGNDDLYALSNRLVSLSSDSSLDTDEDLEDALFKANLSHVRDFNSGRHIRTRRSPRLSKIDPVTTIVCTRIQKNISTKRTNRSKIVITKEATSEVTSVTSKSNFNPQSSNPCGDGASSDDSVICLEDDHVVDYSGVNSCKTQSRENSVVDRSSSILNSKFQVYPKNNITPGISSFYHIIPPKAPSSVLTSCKMLPSSNLAFSSSRIMLSSSSITLYSSSVQMTSARISTSFPYQEFKSVFSDKRIDNLVPGYMRTLEPRPVAKLLCEIGSLFVNGYLSNNSTSHQKYKRIPSTVTICNSGKLEVTLDSDDHFRTEEISTNDLKLMMTRCSCGFMTESANVLQHHYEMGRESGGLQHCCLCDDYSARYSSQFVRHMELEHDQKVRVLPKPWTYLCQLCTFETNGRAIHEKHVRNCQRLFSIKSNLRPNPSDCDIPILKTDVKTETLGIGGEFVTNEAIAEMRNEPSLFRSVDATSEPKLLQIGNHLFVLMAKPTENMTTAASLSQRSSQLGLVKSDRVPQASLTTSMRDHDSGSDDKMQPSGDKQTFPSVTAEQLTPVPPVVPVSSQDISSSGIWVSSLAAAAARSVISNKPATSKMAAIPIRTLTIPEHLSVESVSSAVSPSSDIFKRVAQSAVDRVTPSVKMNRTALIASSSASDDVSRKCSLHVSNVQGNATVSISEPSSFSRLSLPATEPSKLHLQSDAADLPLQVRSLRKDVRNESPDSFVICPLCSGFVKDYECLETHMTVCHKNVDTSLASIRHSQCIPVKCLPTTTALCKQQPDIDFGDSSAVGHCPHCGLSGISDILAHVKEKHHNIALHNVCNGRYCFLCHCPFESTKAFEKHVAESHNTLGSDVNTFRREIYSSDARMMCPVCGKKDLFNLVRHMENRHNVTMIEMLKLLFCNFCSYNSQDALDFESHMLESHSDLFPSRDYLWDEIFTKQKSSRVSDPSDEFGGTFKCSSCDDEFVSASYRFRHEIMSHPHLPFVSLLFKKNLETSETLARRQDADHPGLGALPCKRSSTDKFAKCNSSSNGNSSSSKAAVNLCSSPETVVITDEEEEVVEPCAKQPRLETDRVTEVDKSIPVENIEEVLEIDGETVIIVQERD